MGRDQEDLCLQKRLCRQLRQQPNVCVPATQQNQALGVFDNVEAVMPAIVPRPAF